ncbi:YajG family lipoprotein [Shewanella sp. A3A]|uniref:YajG family lipoprotein n=1 Tax=Shewanella electrica TaxID=515560 RepID=A0ABT2FIM9_9GAMM|nr:YajG family lipoprotein [Shewanella electrica]MCH1918580.1 YajG family lipoprotein [Shewanella ferrihydritica]MCH1925269.1 YajG family lipoprotein [Shewanella electrica]MCS4555094.1 YajG family lipoprotein [Shewanella electrica]
MRLFVTLATVSYLLMGCAANSPKTIVLSPEIPQVSTTVTSASTGIALASQDQRSANYIARYLDGDEVSRYVSAAEAPNLTLERVFNQALTHAGYQIDPASNRSLAIVVTQAVTDVDESMLGYEAKTKLAVTINATNENRTFSKSYSATSSLKGPMSADFASLELDINKLMTQLSSRIINDPELNQFLQ